MVITRTRMFMIKRKSKYAFKTNKICNYMPLKCMKYVHTRIFALFIRYDFKTY